MITSRASPAVLTAPCTPSNALSSASISFLVVLKLSIKNAIPDATAVIAKIHGANAFIKVPIAVPKIATVPVSPINAALKAPIFGISPTNFPPTSIFDVPSLNLFISIRSSEKAARIP